MGLPSKTQRLNLTDQTLNRVQDNLANATDSILNGINSVASIGTTLYAKVPLQTANGIKSIVGPFWIATTGTTPTGIASLPWAASGQNQSLVMGESGSVLAISGRASSGVAGAVLAVGIDVVTASVTHNTWTQFYTFQTTGSEIFRFTAPKGMYSFAATNVVRFKYSMSTGGALTMIANLIVEMDA